MFVLVVVVAGTFMVEPASVQYHYNEDSLVQYYQ